MSWSLEKGRRNQERLYSNRWSTTETSCYRRSVCLIDWFLFSNLVLGDILMVPASVHIFAPFQVLVGSWQGAKTWTVYRSLRTGLGGNCFILNHWYLWIHARCLSPLIECRFFIPLCLHTGVWKGRPGKEGEVGAEVERPSQEGREARQGRRPEQEQGQRQEEKQGTESGPRPEQRAEQRRRGGEEQDGPLQGRVPLNVRTCRYRFRYSPTRSHRSGFVT